MEGHSVTSLSPFSKLTATLTHACLGTTAPRQGTGPSRVLQPFTPGPSCNCPVSFLLMGTWSLTRIFPFLRQLQTALVNVGDKQGPRPQAQPFCRCRSGIGLKSTFIKIPPGGGMSWEIGIDTCTLLILCIK